jgi:acetolactate synthase-1/2/3 large subunit
VQCQKLKRDYPVMQPEYRAPRQAINAYYFVEKLGKAVSDDAIIVTDVGAAYQATMQSFQVRGTQRLFHSGGVSAMGVGIPSAIGAAFAGGGRQVICLVGDGGAMVNIQELATIAHHKLPITIFVFENGGYATMQYTQETHFWREAASSPGSGVSFPNFRSVARAFNIAGEHIASKAAMIEALSSMGKYNRPRLFVVDLPLDQILAPRVQSRVEDGKFVPVDFEDMWPYLPRAELAANMAISAASAGAAPAERVPEPVT